MLNTYLNKNTKAASLAFFRIVFGFLMLISVVRFWSYGWIEKFYIQPKFHFTFYGFEWVKPLGIYTYILFLICALAALGIALGFKYKLSASLFFLSFTYIELMDKTTYLNHYYFISIVAFILIFLPAQVYLSYDSIKDKSQSFEYIPQWTVDIIKLLLGIVYFYAGLAKLNSDWLLNAMPLSIWLPANVDMPVIGFLFEKDWVQYFLSWGGAIYDLSIPFLLLYKPTRTLGFLLVVFFHVLTRMLFPIGMFPYIMIISTLIFFEANWHQKVLEYLKRLLKITQTSAQSFFVYPKFTDTILKSFFAFFIIFQLLFPFRYLAYPGELFWTEEGFRFSWRVMLMEKAGYTNFIVTDSKTKQKFRVNNQEFLTTFQEKQMSFQPDFILEYAHFLRDYYASKGIFQPEVRVESYVALNGRLSERFIDPNINLSNEKESFKHKTWILPFNDNILGL